MNFFTKNPNLQTFFFGGGGRGGCVGGGGLRLGEWARVSDFFTKIPNPIFFGGDGWGWGLGGAR